MMSAPEFLVFDVFYDVENPASSAAVLEVVKARIGNACFIESVHEMNYVPAGQSRSRSGTSIGLRVVLNVVEASEDEIQARASSLMSTPIEGVKDERFMDAGGLLRYPTTFTTAKSVGEHGHLMLCVGFTNGAGGHGQKKVDNAKANQAKDTKNSLDFVSNQGPLPPALRSIFTDPRFYLTKSTTALTGASVGAAYQFQYNLKDTINAMMSASEGTWWGSDRTTSFTTSFDAGHSLLGDSATFDPSTWPHRKNFREVLNNGRELLDQGDLQDESDGSAFHYERRRNLMPEYEFERVARFVERLEGTTPLQLELGGDQADLKQPAAALRPHAAAWYTREWIDMLHSILLTYKPRIWSMPSLRIYHLSPFL
jgi:hypothetical protein